MTLEISISRRNEIKSLVYNTLMTYGTPVLPVGIGDIIRKIKYIKLITYSSQIKKYGITYEELLINAETKDSYVVYQKSTGRYCIYYNDIDRNIVNSNRVRWNLAHELGHVILKHHEITNLGKLFRDGVDDLTYHYLELEADYFAQLILVPHVVLYAFKVSTSSHIEVLCKISRPAANRRFRAYQDWKQHIDAKDPYDKPLFYFYYDYIFKKQCRNCGASLVQRHGKYCPICGEKNTLQWGDGKMIYPKLDSYENGKIKICPVCQNEETNIEGTYCQICGHTLANYCTNYDCSNGNELPTNARYCPICGSASTFFNAGYLKKWNYKDTLEDLFLDTNNDDEIDEELPFA